MSLQVALVLNFPAQKQQSPLGLPCGLLQRHTKCWRLGASFWRRREAQI